MRPGRSTLDRWIRDWRAGGFDALMPGGRQVSPRTSAGVLELAVALKKEKPQRTAAQVHRILVMRLRPGRCPRRGPSSGTSSAWNLPGWPALKRPRRPSAGSRPSAPGELWVSDVLHGPPPARGQEDLPVRHRRRPLPVHHRALVDHQEDTLGLFAALRRAIEAHGAPKIFYVDNGSPYVPRQLLHALATLGIKITHSRPRRPQGRGKVERLFETVRAQFLVEVTAADGTAGQAGTVLESAGLVLRSCSPPGCTRCTDQARPLRDRADAPGNGSHAPGSVL